jgi:Icc-related predicted phosphoesterase
MKLLSVSDLHFNRALFAGLERAVARHSPDVIAVAGDTTAFFEPPKGVLYPDEAARLLTEIAGNRPVVFCRGNHDRETPFLDFWKHRAPSWILPEGAGCEIGGVGFVAFPSEMNSDPLSLSLLEWRAWLPKLTTGQQRGVYLMHEPPTAAALADWFCASTRFEEPIRRYSPALVVSGHDHRRPVETGIWKTPLGNSVVVCAGQGNARLRYTVAELEPRPGTAPILRSIQRHAI